MYFWHSPFWSSHIKQYNLWMTPRLDWLYKPELGNLEEQDMEMSKRGVDLRDLFKGVRRNYIKDYLYRFVRRGLFLKCSQSKIISQNLDKIFYFLWKKNGSKQSQILFSYISNFGKFSWKKNRNAFFFAITNVKIISRETNFRVVNYRKFL